MKVRGQKHVIDLDRPMRVFFFYPPSRIWLSCSQVIPFATNLYVRAVGLFTFCVGLAWFAR